MREPIAGVPRRGHDAPAPRHTRRRGPHSPGESQPGQRAAPPHNRLAPARDIRRAVNRCDHARLPRPIFDLAPDILDMLIDAALVAFIRHALSRL